VIIHLFNDESRRYYDLDNLWGDARKIEWESAKSAT
jgi:ribosomal silencing factor RsfS